MDSGKKRKLNIAMVCDAVTDCMAGSFVSTMRFSEILTKRGHKVIFVAARSSKNPVDNFWGNIKAYRFPSILLPKSEGQLYIAFAGRKKIKEILKKENIDIVHTMIPTPIAVSSTKAAKSLGIKVVAHSHTQPENLTMHIPINFLQGPVNYCFYKYLSWLYAKADALIYPTEFSKQLMHQLKEHRRSFVVSNGVDTEIYKKVDYEPLLKKFHLPKNTTNLMYMGRLHPEKSLDTLIKAVPLIIANEKNVHLLIGGFGHLEKKLESLAKELGVGKNITFLGKISDEDKIMAYNACDIFVLPSLAELEGMVVLEAMACGKPIIIADSKESASTYFVEGNGYLFKSKNHRDLAHQVLRLLINKELMLKMGKVSFKNSQNYDINKSVSKLENIYHSVLNEK